MRAIIWTAYGSPEVLQLQHIPQPTPQDNDILIRTYASSVTAGDMEMRRVAFAPWLALPIRAYMGFRKPTRVRVLGQEFAGEVVAVGADVTRFKVGDKVCGSPGLRLGGYAEYMAIPQNLASIMIMPSNMGYDEAVTIAVGATEAHYFITEANVQAGQHILINGAGGSIGTYAVQLAKHLGAQVTVVDMGDKLTMLRNLGADYVIDYTRDDFTQSSTRYDAVIDVIGKAPFAGSLGVLKADGCFVGNPRMVPMLTGGWRTRGTNYQVKLGTVEYTPERLDQIRELIEAGAMKAVIDKHFPLEQTADAHRYAETGAKQGHVIIAID